MKKILLTLLFSLLLQPTAQAAETLRLGILPVVDSMVLYAALDEGYFREAGLDVQLVLFQSGLERDAAVQAKTLDGYLGEIGAPILHRILGLDFTIVATTYYSNPRSRMFGLVTSPKYAAATTKDLKGADIAISHGTIVDYLLGSFLQAGGLAETDITRRDIRKIPVRVQMLLAGQVDAALLPEPLLSVVEKAGGKVLLDDRIFSKPLAIIALTSSKAQPQTVMAFQAAFKKAAEKINADPAYARELLLRYKLIPEALRADFTPPYFDVERVPALLPSREEFALYLNWMVDRGLGASKMTGGGPRYEDVVFQP